MKRTDNPSVLEPAFPLQERLVRDHLTVTSCFQCRKCSNGCPVVFAMDLLPDKVIRMALLGQEDRLLDCRTIWVCSSCQTCTTRCPNDIDIAGVMDWLKEEALARGRAVAEPGVADFHRIFLDSVRAGGGRLAEIRLMQHYMLATQRRRLDLPKVLENMKMGWNLFKRGRLRLLGPRALKGKKEIAAIFAKTVSSEQ